MEGSDPSDRHCSTLLDVSILHKCKTISIARVTDRWGTGYCLLCKSYKEKTYIDVIIVNKRTADGHMLLTPFSHTSFCEECFPNSSYAKYHMHGHK